MSSEVDQEMLIGMLSWKVLVVRNVVAASLLSVWGRLMPNKANIGHGILLELQLELVFNLYHYLGSREK